MNWPGPVPFSPTEFQPAVGRVDYDAMVMGIGDVEIAVGGDVEADGFAVVSTRACAGR